MMSWRQYLFPSVSTRAAIVVGLVVGLLTTVGTGQDVETGNHPDWPRWCGKVYKAGYPAFDPGGQTLPPTPHPNAPLLHVQIKPRYSLYLESEEYAELIVKAELSQYHGTPWSISNSSASGGNSDRSNWLIFSVHLVETDDVVISNKVIISNTTTTNIFSFPLSRLKKKTPTLKPIELVLYGAPEGGHPTWTATTSILYLPEKPFNRTTGQFTGSVTKIDNLDGGLYVRNPSSNNRFLPLFPYGFFGSHDNFLRNQNFTAEIQAYANLGLNAMTPLTIYSDSAAVFAYMDLIDLKFMYNLREGYKNLTYVREQVRAARDADALFAYWSTDEPDGWQDPFHHPRNAYALIRELDPYHPVAIVLNCQNYYFKEYSVDTSDIIMEDVYPIGINSTYSKWDTACTPVLGDCGCDNCQGNVQDVSDRLDALSQYEEWLGLWPKMKIHNPQSFHGQDYWFRDPTTEEEWVMCLLAVNHGARGLISWLWPASTRLGRAHGDLARVITQEPVVDFLVGRYLSTGTGTGRLGPVKTSANVVVAGGDEKSEVIDAAYWIQTEQQQLVFGDSIVQKGRSNKKKMLVSVVNGGYVDINSPVVISVPNATVIESIPWANGARVGSGGAVGNNSSQGSVVLVEWKLQGFTLTASRLPAMGTWLVILDMLSV